MPVKIRNGIHIVGKATESWLRPTATITSQDKSHSIPIKSNSLRSELINVKVLSDIPLDLFFVISITEQSTCSVQARQFIQ
jgi:hypothetical protein